MDSRKQTQAGYMFGIARKQFVDKFEQITLFTSRQHWFNNSCQHSGNFILFSKLEIYPCDFNVTAVIRNVLRHQDGRGALGAGRVFRVDIRLCKH